jgi:N-acetylneuraminic acid mutarotase
VLIGNCDNCGPDNFAPRLYRYDPVTNLWTALAWAPHPHSSGAGAVINGKFYVAGGSENFEPSNKLDVYDPVTNRWTTRAPMPTARSGVAGAAIQNKLYIMGRYGQDLGVPGNQVEAYDPVTNTWSTKTPMSLSRGDLAAASLTFGGRPYILAVGGFEVGAGGGKLNEAYTP